MIVIYQKLSSIFMSWHVGALSLFWLDFVRYVSRVNWGQKIQLQFYNHDSMCHNLFINLMYQIKYNKKRKKKHTHKKYFPIYDRVHSPLGRGGGGRHHQIPICLGHRHRRRVEMGRGERRP